jgi:hypothetical protein
MPIPGFVNLVELAMNVSNIRKPALIVGAPMTLPVHEFGRGSN